MNEDKQIFKAYLRGLLRHLEQVREARLNGDYETAERLLDELIEDTKKGIEDK